MVLLAAGLRIRWSQISIEWRISISLFHSIPSFVLRFKNIIPAKMNSFILFSAIADTISVLSFQLPGMQIMVLGLLNI